MSVAFCSTAALAAKVLLVELVIGDGISCGNVGDNHMVDQPTVFLLDQMSKVKLTVSRIKQELCRLSHRVDQGRVLFDSRSSQSGVVMELLISGTICYR